MHNVTKEELLNALETTFVKKHTKLFTLIVEGNCPKPEMISNPPENYSAKRDYIMHAYNDDLTLKNVPHIKITGWHFEDYNGCWRERKGSSLEL